MKAIEIEATVEKHCIRLPDAIPDGTHLRVLLLLDDEPVSVTKQDALDFPVDDLGPWPRGLNLSRAELYGDDER